MRTKRKFAKIGEKVRVIRPFIFERVGYPLSKEELRYRPDVQEMVQKALAAIGVGLNPDGKVVSHMEDAVITFVMHREGFGGKERRVHEKETLEIQGCEGEVTTKRIVYEGDYSPGYTSGYYEPEWTPPYLENAKAHCIYGLQITRQTCPDWFVPWIEIDAQNCETIG